MTNPNPESLTGLEKVVSAPQAQDMAPTAESTSVSMTYQELSSLSREALLKEPCDCVICVLCGGKGTIKVDRHGRFITYYDDCYDLESCPDCMGGVTETCDRCHALDETEEEL